MSNKKDIDLKKCIINPDISWIVDHASVKLINENTNTVKILNYPEAAIWDFITRGYPTEKLILLISKIAYINTSHATTIINDTIESLYKQGFLKRI